MRGNVWNRGIKNNGIFLYSALPLLALMVILLLLGSLDVFAPSIISHVLPGTNVAGVLAPAFQVLLLSVITMAIVIMLRQNELVATIVLAVHLYIDWYLGLVTVVPILTLLLLLILYFTRSSEYPWVEPRALWLWLLWLVFAIYPAIQGASVLYDALYYYPNIIFGALVMFWLGSVVARDGNSVRRLFQFLAVLGTFLAIITIVQARTGVLLLGTSRFDNFLASTGDYQLATGVDVYRLGSFFVDPNWNACFFVLMLCIPLGLFVTSSSALEKIICLVETFLILVALLFTYSFGGWLGAIAGITTFTLLSGRTYYRMLIVVLAVIGAVGMVVLFPAQVNLLFQHATRSDELSLHMGAWQTALNVILAFPLTGIGLGKYTYVLRADPYRSITQTIPLDHPHNSYLELAAMGGLPILLIFIALVLVALLQALRNWKLADRGISPVLAAGIASIVGLSINSLSINGWTLPPLAAFAWLILGAVSSPLLAKSYTQEEEKTYTVLDLS